MSMYGKNHHSIVKQYPPIEVNKLKKKKEKGRRKRRRMKAVKVIRKKQKGLWHCSVLEALLSAEAAEWRKDKLCFSREWSCASNSTRADASPAMHEGLPTTGKTHPSLWERPWHFHFWTWSIISYSLGLPLRNSQHYVPIPRGNTQCPCDQFSGGK